MNNVSVRVAKESDAADIAKLTSQLGYSVEPSAVRARLSSILARPEQRFLVAELDSHTVGWMHAAVVAFVDVDTFVMIAGLVVARSCRRQGIGRVLMEHAEAWAKDQGCTMVRLWSSAARTGAHGFYQELGYTHIKTQYSFAKSLDPAGQDAMKALVPQIEG